MNHKITNKISKFMRELKKELKWYEYINQEQRKIDLQALFMLHLKKFKKIVKTDGPWDFKSNLRQMNKNDESVCPKCKEAVTLCGMCIQYEAISNFHYGYVALSGGIFEKLGEYGAGVAQIHDNKKIGWIEAAEKAIWWAFYGDELADNFAIKLGYEYYNTGDLCEIIRRKAREGKLRLKGVNSNCKPQKEVGMPPNIQKDVSW